MGQPRVPLPDPQNQAIHAALDALINKMRTECTLCQTYVFSKVVDANLKPIFANHFADWLSSPPARLYDGTKSTGSVAANAFPPSFSRAWLQGGGSIASQMNLDQTDAITCAGRPDGCGPLLTFLRPTAINLSNGGVNDDNMSLLFHESLHGITGLKDTDLQTAFGCTTKGGTHNLTDYVRQFIISPPPQLVTPCQ